MTPPTPEDRRPPLTPQLALRVAVIGTVALAMFAIVFFRLWFLQVLSGQQYSKAASINFIRDVQVSAPRGEVLDRNGVVLARSVRGYAVEITPANLPVPLTTTLPTAVIDQYLAHPPRADAALYARLAHLLNIPRGRVKCQVGVPAPSGHLVASILRVSQIACDVDQGFESLPYANVTIATDIPTPQCQLAGRVGPCAAEVLYLSERQAEFPSVSVEQIYQRNYPSGFLAPQVLGIVGRISKTEIGEPTFHGYSPNDAVGQSGLESTYETYLHGTDGTDEIKVDALGNFNGYVKQVPPTPGNNLRISLDSNLQQVGLNALQHSIDSNYPAAGGAFVAMNPQNGEVYGMGSLPTYDANLFTRPVPTSVYDQFKVDGFPLINRAIQGGGPTGSTFKPITATAALESGAWKVGDTYDDTGQFCIGIQCRHNAGGGANGVLDLVNAIKVSSDVFFYNLGALLNPADPATHPNGGPLQHWAHLYGIGQPTGIDLPGELSGNLPTPAWRQAVDNLELKCEKRHHVPASEYFSYSALAVCGIADGRSWSIGDDISLAVGQGDVVATPLQLAVAYAAIANGGAVVRPHLGLQVILQKNGNVHQFNPPAVRHLPLNQTYLDTIRAGLRAAASQPGGTSADVFQNFPEPVYGKTGTAQYNGQQDYSWYACFVPATLTRKPIVVVVWVEQGGFGAVASAPVARQILSQWFFGKSGPWVAGSSKTL